MATITPPYNIFPELRGPLGWVRNVFNSIYWNSIANGVKDMCNLEPAFKAALIAQHSGLLPSNSSEDVATYLVEHTKRPRMLPKGDFRPPEFTGVLDFVNQYNNRFKNPIHDKLAEIEVKTRYATLCQAANDYVLDNQKFGVTSAIDSAKFADIAQNPSIKFSDLASKVNEIIEQNAEIEYFESFSDLQQEVLHKALFIYKHDLAMMNYLDERLKPERLVVDPDTHTFIISFEHITRDRVTGNLVNRYDEYAFDSDGFPLGSCHALYFYFLGNESSRWQPISQTVLDKDGSIVSSSQGECITFREKIFSEAHEHQEMVFVEDELQNDLDNLIDNNTEVSEAIQETTKKEKTEPTVSKPTTKPER